MAYLPALRAGLIWNDIDYITKPELRSVGGLWRIWTWPFLEGWDILTASGPGGGIGITEQYYPLLHSFFWVQHRLWGSGPLGYHLVNILLHATAACLLGGIVARLVGSRPAPGPGRMAPATLAAGIAAAVFALHPVMVESVAWISEQKNTLSTVFYLWAGLVYLRFDETRERRTYRFATILFLCAALSKSLAATLPAALLVAIWWRRGRIARSDVTPLVPWFIAFVALGLVTGRVERNFIGAQGADFALNFVERGVLAGRVIWFYLGKLAWPAELIFIYPRWEISAADLVQWIFPVAAIALLVVLWLIRRRTRGPLAAYLYFVGTLFPTIGFFNVYAFKFSYVADHWQYLPSVGAIVFVAISLAVLGQRYLSSRNARIVGAALAALAFAWLGTQTFGHSRGYRDMETFYRTILAKNDQSWLALNNLGKHLVETNRPAEAIPFFERTIKLRPNDGEPYNGLGVAYRNLRRDQEAADAFQEAIRKVPRYAEAHYNLGNLLYSHQLFPEAAERFRAAVASRPNDPGSQHNLGATLSRLGRDAEAVEHYLRAVALRPVYPLAYSNLGFSYMNLGRYREAMQAFDTAMQQGLVTPEIHANIGSCLIELQLYEPAIAQFQAALRLNPSLAIARTRLAQAQELAARGPRGPSNPNDASRLVVPGR